MGDNQKRDIDDTALKTIDSVLDSKSKQIELLATTTPIYVLGCHETQLTEMEGIRNKIEELKFIGRLVKEHKDRDFLPDFEKEKIILEKGGVIIILDGRIGAVVGESAYLMGCSELLSKCVLMVSKQNEDKILSRTGHYLYYPIKYVYENNIDLIKKASGASIQLAISQAIAEINKREKINKVKKLN